MGEKLVRDLIPLIAKKNGDEVNWRVANSWEQKKLMLDKLKEEILEYEESDAASELADIYQVLADICYHVGRDIDYIAKLAHKKEAERGGFKHWIVMETE